LGRIIAIDYGKKRVGIAATDILQIAAHAIGTYTPDEAVAFLNEYVKKEPIDVIVVGKPMNLNNQPAEAAKGAQEFTNRLRNKFPDITIEQYDERFTSRMAMQAIIAGGVRKMDRRDKSLVDKVSASIILQSYLDYKNNTKFHQ
jgi:putative Holliday junction resolvase